MLSFLYYFSEYSLLNFSVDYEGSYAEKYQYLKFIGISIICFLISIKKRSFPFLNFMIIPTYLYLDDSRELHERFGSKIGQLLTEGSYMDTLFINLRYQDFGEIIYMVLMAFLLLIIFVLSYKLSIKSEKIFFLEIIKLFFLFGIFAIFFDLIHQLSWGGMNKILGIVEDGGEMIIVTFICYSFFQNLRKKENNQKSIKNSI